MSDTREVNRYEFGAEGTDEEPLATFTLIRRTEFQVADKRVAGGWRTNSRDRVVLEEGITRRQLVQIISDAADWLAYLGEGT
jgi:hypothetical protein